MSETMKEKISNRLGAMLSESTAQVSIKFKAAKIVSKKVKNGVLPKGKPVAVDNAKVEKLIELNFFKTKMSLMTKKKEEGLWPRDVTVMANGMSATFQVYGYQQRPAKSTDKITSVAVRDFVVDETHEELRTYLIDFLTGK